MNEKDIKANLADHYLLREDMVLGINRLDQKINGLKVELMKARKNANDTHDAESAGSASGERDGG
jgi:hypothetical protein